MASFNHMGAKRVEQPMAKTRVLHPGRILLQEWLDPCGISQNQLARQMNLSPRRVNEIVLGKRAITAATAIRLEQVFGKDSRYWMRLQMEYELDQASLPPEQRARKLPAPKRSRAARRYDAIRFVADEGITIWDAPESGEGPKDL